MSKTQFKWESFPGKIGKNSPEALRDIANLVPGLKHSVRAFLANPETPNTESVGFALQGMTTSRKSLDIKLKHLSKNPLLPLEYQSFLQSAWDQEMKRHKLVCRYAELVLDHLQFFRDRFAESIRLKLDSDNLKSLRQYAVDLPFRLSHAKRFLQSESDCGAFLEASVLGYLTVELERFNYFKGVVGECLFSKSAQSFSDEKKGRGQRARAQQEIKALDLTTMEGRIAKNDAKLVDLILDGSDDLRINLAHELKNLDLLYNYFLHQQKIDLPLQKRNTLIREGNLNSDDITLYHSGLIERLSQQRTSKIEVMRLDVSQMDLSEVVSLVQQSLRSIVARFETDGLVERV